MYGDIISLISLICITGHTSRTLSSTQCQTQSVLNDRGSVRTKLLCVDCKGGKQFYNHKRKLH